jgi:hypothetical protein
LRCLIQSFYQSLIKTNHHVKQNQSNKGIYGSTLVVPALSPFMLFQVNVVAQEKVEMEKSYNYQHYQIKNKQRFLNPVRK